MPDPVPDKGIILTQISLYWFEIMKPIIDNHVVSANVDEYPAVCQPYAENLRGRSMLVKKTEPLSIECVVRGYISGSGWNSYQKSGSICGIQLPEGLTEASKLPEPLFTPSTKAEIGDHDATVGDIERQVTPRHLRIGQQQPVAFTPEHERAAYRHEQRRLIRLLDLDDGMHASSVEDHPASHVNHSAVTSLGAAPITSRPRRRP